jgi:hypothetical protein
LQKWDLIRKKRGEMQENLDKIVAGNRRHTYWAKVVRVLQTLRAVRDVHEDAVAFANEEHRKLELALMLQHN